jgi:hypothetical protein
MSVFWSLKLREDRRLSVVNRVLRRIVGPKVDVVTGDNTKNNEVGGACTMYGGEVYTGLWWGNLRERDHLVDPDGTIIKAESSGSGMGGAWTGLICLG